MTDNSFKIDYKKDSLISCQTISVPSYYSYGKNGEIIIDEDSMREEFETKLKELVELAK